jgi:hypothetical protein
MEENNKSQLMGEKEFTEYIESNKENIAKDFIDNNIIYLRSFLGVKTFKSIRRAIRRGRVSLYGEICPKRPFNNRGNTTKRKYKHSRLHNEIKKDIYEQLRGK